MVSNRRKPAPAVKQESKCYAEGARAWNQGKYLSDCPYRLLSKQGNAWVSGWCDASNRNKPEVAKPR